MDRDGFEADERKRGLRRSLTEKAIHEVERLESFLASRSKNPDTATASDVEDCLEERTMSTVATLPKEARFTVDLASRLPPIADFS